MIDEATKSSWSTCPPDELLNRLREGKVYISETGLARVGEVLP